MQHWYRTGCPTSFVPSISVKDPPGAMKDADAHSGRVGPLFESWLRNGTTPPPNAASLAYFKIPGVPLRDLPRQHRLAHAASIAATLGEFLRAMHAVPVDWMADLIDTDDDRPAEWRREAAETYPKVAAQVPLVHRHAVEAFLDASPPDDGYALAFSHNDLGIEHDPR